MKKKVKSYTFWLAFIGSLIILINTLGNAFGFSVDEVAITSILTAILGIFVTLGLVIKDNKQEDEQTDKEQIDIANNSTTQKQDNENKNTDAQ